MKTFKTTLLLILISAIVFSSFRSDVKDETYQYAFITVTHRAFSKKLAVQVDFGDSEKQMEVGQKLSVQLSEKSSFAAILNYMSSKGFNLMETVSDNASYQGTGGTNGVTFIMLKKK